MVRVRGMTCFQDHKWYNELADGKLKVDTLMHKAKVEGSWGDATPGVMKLCAWLKSSFENLHELDHDGPYANAKTEKAYDPYLDINHIFRRNYGKNNAGNTQDNHGPIEQNPTYDSVCQIRKFKMMKYSFDTDDDYVAIKEHEHHSRANVDSYQAYQELFRIMDKGWLVAMAKEE
ncbi:hypothetical protein Tco_0641290 [Tanacetum coccineum]